MNSGVPRFQMYQSSSSDLHCKLKSTKVTGSNLLFAVRAHQMGKEGQKSAGLSLDYLLIVTCCDGSPSNWPTPAKMFHSMKILIKKFVYEFSYTNSYMNSYKLWIHMFFSYMNSYVSWINVWILVYQGSRCINPQALICTVSWNRRKSQEATYSLQLEHIKWERKARKAQASL